LAALIGLPFAFIININFNKAISRRRRAVSNAANVFAMAGACVLFVYYYGLTYRFVIYVMLTVNLLYMSNCDIREKAVSRETIIVSVICALAALIWNKDSAWWACVASGLGFAGIFMLVSRITRGSIGSGDALIIGVIGLHLGFFHALAVIFYALLLGGVLSLILFLMKKVSRRTSLPFVPFLTAGFLVSILR
jgi:prepilin signal peptidase PulO-like enzyme (type II secretory pathway)